MTDFTLLALSHIIQFYLANLNIADQIHNLLQLNLLQSLYEFHNFSSYSLVYGIHSETARTVLLISGIIIFIGVIAESYFRKTGIPDILFLMALGVVIGPVLGIVSFNSMIKFVPYFSALALVMIMFDGGSSLNVGDIFKTARLSFILSILSFIGSVTVVTLIALYGLHWQFINSLLLAVMVGETGPVVVFSLLRRLPVSDAAKTTLGIDSVISSILSIIVVFILIGAMTSGGFQVFLIWTALAKFIGVGLVLGFGIGIPWMYIDSKIGNTKHAYLLTIGILFALYFFARELGESGALTALVFGLILGNRKFFSHRLKMTLPVISGDSFHEELLFLVRIFFFVFVGMLIDLKHVEYFVFGVLMSIAIFLSRSGIARALTKRFSKFERNVAAVMVPRGIASAVLATVPLAYGLPDAKLYPEIVFIIIIVTVAITTIGISVAKKKGVQSKETV